MGEAFGFPAVDQLGEGQGVGFGLAAPLMGRRGLGGELGLAVGGRISAGGHLAARGFGQAAGLCRGEVAIPAEAQAADGGAAPVLEDEGFRAVGGDAQGEAGQVLIEHHPVLAAWRTGEGIDLPLAEFHGRRLGLSNTKNTSGGASCYRYFRG